MKLKACSELEMNEKWLLCGHEEAGVGWVFRANVLLKGKRTAGKLFQVCQIYVRRYEKMDVLFRPNLFEQCKSKPQ